MTADAVARGDRPRRPPLRRDADRRVLAGVAAGIGRSLNVEPVVVRIVLAVLTPLSGIGLLIYVVAWALMPTADGGRPLAARAGAWQIAGGACCLTLAALLTVRELGLWWSDAFVWPFVLASSGLGLLWHQTSTRMRAAREEREKPRAPLVEAADEAAAAAVPAAARPPLGSGLPERLRSIYQGGFAIALVVGAALIFLQAIGALSGARDVVLSFVVLAAGFTLILAPFWRQMMRNANEERAARIRSQERAEVAAHLHDSVLQTLALVQKRADDPRAVATLARRQERELRAWLSSAPEARPDERLADALRAAAAEVEEAHGVPVEVVTVGDRDLDDRHRALVAAAREALANAARHSGSEEPIALFMEVADDRTEVFVRDRGVGFDPSTVGDDRRGVRESIVGRMARHGGRAAVHSTPGAGTEVELVVDG